jgi:N-hydroxyarylamine O-acetyltransferase
VGPTPNRLGRVDARLPIEELDPGLVAAYLERLGARDDLTPTLATLGRLHRAHRMRVPFENLDIHLGVPIVLDVPAFAEKIAHRSRGGFCYELNGAFASLLASLGFAVELLASRVHGPDGLGQQRGHLTLAVHVDDATYLADVGFGRGSFDEPLRLVAVGPQQDDEGTFELHEAGGGELDLLCEGVPQYRVALPPRALDDFTDACAWTQTSPDSVFLRGTICTIRTAAGRATIAGTRLIETAGDERSDRALVGPEFGRVLRERFGVELSGAELARLARQDASPLVQRIH